jgi:iron only hydrogenase large subunit-like protein
MGLANLDSTARHQWLSSYAEGKKTAIIPEMMAVDQLTKEQANRRYMLLISACPNWLHLTSVAPSIRRAKS